MNERGQSLVEMALIMPLLLIMLLGLFEVGYALRNYLVLANANREAARFAVRPGYLDFEANDPGWGGVYSHTLAAVSDQLPEFQSQSALIGHYIEIQPGVPCDPTDLEGCDCALAATNPYTAPTVHYAEMAGYEQYRVRYGLAVSSTLDYPAIIGEAAKANNTINCQIQKREGRIANSSLIVVEMFYQHRQLFGFPFISNRFTDPIPMYGHTAMRYIQGIRGSGQEDDPFRGE